jgi:uncharacterized protein
MRRVTGLLLILVSGALGVWAILLALVWRFQERVVFQPPPVLASPPDPRRVTFSSADGVPLAGYVVGDPRTAPVVLLVFHGNAELARWRLPWAEEVVRRTRAAVFITEYRGYDGLPGPPTYEGTQRDAEASLRFAEDSLGVGVDRLVFFGFSLGSAVATELAAAVPPRALILQSPFNSARGMALRFPVPGLRWFWDGLSRVHFETARRVGGLNVPVWVAHGDRDLVIPARMGREVYDSARRKGELLVVPGAGHNDVAERGGEGYWRWLGSAVGSSAADRTLSSRVYSR